MANYFFSILNAQGITTNPNVGYLCAIAFYVVIIFMGISFINTYGVKGVLRMLEASALFSCRLVLEVFIFFCILFRYRKSNFFSRYEKRRKKVLKKIAHR